MDQRIFFGFFSLAIIGVSIPARGQNACEGIKSSEDRLKCYDAVAAARKESKSSKLSQHPKEDPIIQRAKSAIRANLKDPGSARFEGIVKRPAAVCGFVNARTSMGGYSGRTMFVYLIKENKGYILEISDDIANGRKALAAAEANCQGVPGF